MNKPVLEARQISKRFKNDSAKVLSNVSFTVNRGEFVSLMGKSGCGKSTLLYVLSTMDTDYEGELILDGELLTAQNAGRLAQIRNEKIGFVFQFHYLLNEFTVLKNIMLPGMKLDRYPEQELEDQAMKWLSALDITEASNKYPNQLSGGEKQRVAIARALINQPLIIMADEPTGNLDKRNSQKVFDIFRQLSEEFNQTLLIVTHDTEFAAATGRRIIMEDGKIVL